MKITKALIIGIQKYNSSSMPSLDGPYADILNIQQFVKSMNPCANIMTLDDHNNNNNPTRNNIINELNNIYNDVNSEEIVIIYYSGHGSNISSSNNDEYDVYYDQVMNVLNNEIIKDNELHTLIVKNKPNKNIKTIVIFDCCHSGDILDLDYKLTDDKFTKIRNINNQNKNKSLTTLISGCAFTQSTTDAPKGGAFTKRFLDILKENNNKVTYSYLFSELQKRLNYLKVYFGMSQEPQVFSSKLISKNDYLF